jgi:hypothetical protein
MAHSNPTLFCFDKGIDIMGIKHIIATAGLLMGSGIVWSLNSGNAHAQSAPQLPPTEYAVIQWDGRENTRFIRPNGTVEKLRPVLEGTSRPDGVHDRSFYLAIALNAVAREGFEYAGTIDGDLVVKRIGIR